MFFYDKVKFSLPHVQIFLYKMMPNQSLVGAQKVGHITIKEETFIDRHFRNSTEFFRCSFSKLGIRESLCGRKFSKLFFSKFYFFKI